MSLKAFHIVFVAASVALSLMFALWGWSQYSQLGRGAGILWAGLGVASAVGLTVYGRYFLRKLRHISFL